MRWMLTQILLPENDEFHLPLTPSCGASAIHRREALSKENDINWIDFKSQHNSYLIYFDQRAHIPFTRKSLQLSS